MKKQTPTARNSRARDLVLMALFTAIILIMAFTPLGLIDLPIIKATILHVPVIIGAILLGPKQGTFFGLLFALTSLFKNTTTPSLLSFAFSPLIPVPGAGRGSLWALVICFVPRILVGVVPWFVYQGLRRLLGDKPGRKTVQLAIAGASGAIVNTGLVMGLIGTVLADGFAHAKGIGLEAVTSGIMAIVLANGVPETIAAIVLTAAVCLPVMRMMGLYQPPAPAGTAPQPAPIPQEQSAAGPQAKDAPAQQDSPQPGGEE